MDPYAGLGVLANDPYAELGKPEQQTEDPYANIGQPVEAQDPYAGVGQPVETQDPYAGVGVPPDDGNPSVASQPVYQLPPISKIEIMGGPVREEFTDRPDMPEAVSAVTRNLTNQVTTPPPPPEQSAVPASVPSNVLDQKIRNREIDIERLEQAKARGVVVENKGGFWAQVRQGLTGQGDALSPVEREWGEQDEQALADARQAMQDMRRQRDEPAKLERFAGAAADVVIPSALRGDASFMTDAPDTFGENLTQIAGGVAGIPLAFLGPRKAAMQMARTPLGQNVLMFALHGQAYMPTDSGVGARVERAGKDVALGAVFSGLSAAEQLGRVGQVLAPAGLFATGYGMAKADGGSDEDAVLSGAVMLYLHYAGRVGSKIDQISARRQAKAQVSKDLTERFGKESADRILSRADAEVNKILQEPAVQNLSGAQRQEYADWARRTGIENATKAERLRNVTLADRAELQHVKGLAKQGDAAARRWLEWKVGIGNTSGTAEPSTPWRVGSEQGATRAKETVRLLTEQATQGRTSPAPTNLPEPQPGGTSTQQGPLAQASVSPVTIPAPSGASVLSSQPLAVLNQVAPTINGFNEQTGSVMPVPAPAGDVTAEPGAQPPSFQAKIGKAVLMMHGKSNKPYRVRIKRILGDGSEVLVEPVGSANNIDRFNNNNVPKQVSITHLADTPQTSALQRRSKQLAGLSREDRTRIEADAKAFDDILASHPAFYDSVLVTRMTTAASRRDQGYARSQWLRQERNEAARLLGVDPDKVDMSNPVERASLLPKMQEWFKSEVGQNTTSRVKKLQEQPDEPVNEAEFNHGDIVYKGGEWYQVNQDSGVTRLIDGEVITLNDFESVDVAGVLSPGDPAYDVAMRQYQKQEKALGKEVTVPVIGQPESAGVQGLEAQPSSAIKATNPTTGQTEMIGQEEGGFKLVNQDDPAAAARQAAVEAKAAADAQAAMDARQGRLFGDANPIDAAADVAGAARERGKAGAISVGNLNRGRMRAVSATIRELLTPHRGVGEQVYGYWVKAQAQKDAAVGQGREDEARIEQVLREVRARVGRPQAQQVMRQFQDGALTLTQVEQALGLPSNGPLSQSLRVIEANNQLRQRLLAGWSGISDNLRQHILNNVQYQTRAYMRHILGPDYIPPAAAIQDALTSVENDLIAQLDRFDRRATAVRGKRGLVDVVNYLPTGDPVYLANLSPTRRAAAEGLREQYLNLQHLITGLQQQGQTVAAIRNANALHQAANDLVEYYTSRETPGQGGAQGGIKIANLQHRTLDLVFRRLYGEVLDPAMRQRITSEVQGSMLAQMTFFNRVINEAEGLVWSRYVDQERGFVHRLGDVMSQSDRKRYGDLNGVYVNKEFLDLINSQKATDDNVRKVMDMFWFKPMAVQRGAKLLNPRTIARNAYTGVLGFAQGSGDAYLPGFWPSYWKAHGLAARYARGDVKALEEMKGLFADNVFRPGTNTSTYDVNTMLGNPIGRLGRMGRNVMTAYTFIDFPSKYAAYQARRQYFEQRGMSPQDASEAAAQHVRDLYQNSDRIPEVVRKVTKTGLADYMGYTYDSARISANQLRWAVRSLQEYGDARPLIGFMASRALWLAHRKLWLAGITAGIAALHQALRKWWDKQEDREQKVMEDDRSQALREFMQPFDKDQPSVMWEEKRKDGKQYIYYTMLSGQGAFPLEDAMLGALNSSDTGPDFIKGLANNLYGMVDPGMYLNLVTRTLAGKDFSGKRTPTGMGLLEYMNGKEDPKRSQVLQDILMDIGGDFAPGGLGAGLRRLEEIRQQELAGIKPDTWFARTTTKEDATASMIRLVRTYRLEQGDMNAMIRQKIIPLADAIKATKADINTPFRTTVTRGGATQSTQEDAQNGERMMQQYRNQLVEIARNANKAHPEWNNYGNLYLTFTGSGIDAILTMNVLNEALKGQKLNYKYMSVPQFKPTDIIKPDQMRPRNNQPIPNP